MLLLLPKRVVLGAVAGRPGSVEVLCSRAASAAASPRWWAWEELLELCGGEKTREY